MNGFVAVLKKYATFEGRAHRKEYWMYVLIYVLISVVLHVVDSIAGTVEPESGAGLLSSLFVLGTLLPSMAVTVRRLHDIGRSGWWILIGFVPLVGSLILFIFTVKAGEPTENRWGPVPSAEDSLLDA